MEKRIFEVRTRVTEAERDEMKSAAERLRISLSDLIRLKVLGRLGNRDMVQ